MNNRKSIVILISLLAIAGIGIALWADSVLSEIEDDKEQTLNLSKRILDCFPDHVSLYKYPVEYSNVAWNKNYLVIENGGYDELGITYKAKWNEKLGTTQNYPGEYIKGVIVIAKDMLERGEYLNKVGQKERIYQRNYIISYFDLDKKIVLGRDTLYGEEPSGSKRAKASSTADFPKDQAVIDAISSRLQ